MKLLYLRESLRLDPQVMRYSCCDWIVGPLKIFRALAIGIILAVPMISENPKISTTNALTWPPEPTGAKSIVTGTPFAV